MTVDEILRRYDPRNLIGDALALDGLAIEEYRAIFFDWAFGLKDVDAAEAAQALLDLHAPQDGHPIHDLLTAALAGPAARRGRAGRRRVES